MVNKMIKNICKDQKILSQISLPATIDDLSIGQDLIDTLRFNKNRCVGMAANMIGILKRIIVFEADNGELHLMFNPEIISKNGEYITNEGCLSLDGVRETKRYKKIKVSYYNKDFKKRIMTFVDFTAQIIQHEIDHINGIII